MQTLRSSLPGIAWPAVPGGEAARLLGLLFQLERSQWLAPEALARLQFAQFERSVAHAVATVPFYREGLSAHRLARDPEGLREAWPVLAEACRDLGVVLPELRGVRVYGEAVGSHLRRLCREVWGDCRDLHTLSRSQHFVKWKARPGERRNGLQPIDRARDWTPVCRGGTDVVHSSVTGTFETKQQR
jgi:hypothetical protein